MMKHFIDIDQFTKRKLDLLIKDAKSIKKNPNKFLNYFNNSFTLGLLFLKQSTRTRLSFNVGMQQIGGNVIELDSTALGFGKRETEKDILKTLSQFIDCLMIRNNDHKQILYLSSLNYIPIINGLSDYSHPCQILSDLLTIEEKLGNIKTKNISWVGDYNNVLRSLIHLQNIYLFKLNIILPKEIMKKNIQKLKNYKNNNLIFTNNIKEGVYRSNCIMTDAWVSMGEKNLNKKKYFKNFQINTDIIRFSRKDSIFMHCLPAHREEEVTSEVLDSSKSVIWDQAKNRKYVQQAILKNIIKKNES